jgi:dihydrofolate reductase
MVPAATFDSMGKPLPDRRNIVLTRDTALQIPGSAVTHSPAEALAAAGDEETFVDHERMTLLGPHTSPR